jgi:hypothetical protein
MSGTGNPNSSRGGRGGGGGGRGGGSRSKSGVRGGRASDAKMTQNGNAKASKPKRIPKRRLQQIEAMEKKAREDDNYFRKCQEEASRKRKNNSSFANNKARQEELFAKQGTHGINFNKYDEIKVEVKLPDGSNNKSVMQSFDELQLLPQLKKNVALMNYKQPTPIQRNAVPLSMAGNDLMCCAQTGAYFM